MGGSCKLVKEDLNLLLEPAFVFGHDLQERRMLANPVRDEGMHDILLLHTRFKEQFVECPDLRELLQRFHLLLGNLLELQAD